MWLWLRMLLSWFWFLLFPWSDVAPPVAMKWLVDTQTSLAERLHKLEEAELRIEQFLQSYSKNDALFIVQLEAFLKNLRQQISEGKMLLLELELMAEDPVLFT